MGINLIDQEDIQRTDSGTIQHFFVHFVVLDTTALVLILTLHHRKYVIIHHEKRFVSRQSISHQAKIFILFLYISIVSYFPAHNPVC